MDREELKNLGNRLRSLRFKLDISQKDFASEIKLSASYVSDIEKGKTKPGFNFLILIARKFRINPAWLLLEKGNMFLDTNNMPKTEKLVFGENNEQVRKLLVYMKRSPFVYSKVMSYFLPLLYENSELIRKDIEATRESGGIRDVTSLLGEE